MGFFSWSDEDLMLPNHDSDPISPTYESYCSELIPQHRSCTIVWGLCPVGFLWNILRFRNSASPPCDTWIGWLPYSGCTLRRFAPTF
ncbi:hypothetical protein K443DRAFT_104687 [Laccaria amethystina LaAM-08-1]|uniref:Uncharacterized protein n=1 Tax=Laccaria amethystina LaAM-08-1 TaxID=1095629 RepID=A0A0C9WYV2_9AGAR|nr:hypothetical protein K443DRAFT_104687 [Laccaria amethystina LaAM-08-1]